MFKIAGSIKNYAWGKKAEQSVVAKLTSGYKDVEIQSNLPYAELWLGTHASGQAYLLNAQGAKVKPLSEVVEFSINHQRNLPYLFKVLSVNQALSIQAHPDKETAKLLHAKDPKNYPDDNHKPEMAIALTDFEALCGFRPIAEIIELAKRMPEFQQSLGLKQAEEVVAMNEKERKNWLRCSFAQVLNDSLTDRKLPELMRNCEERLRSQSDLTEDERLFVRLHQCYPGDVGCFAALFLNYLKLKPGESIFLAANQPHAYLFGDCMECMANSDNVVRAGLTPKFMDVQVLLNILTYEDSPGCSHKVTPSFFNLEKTAMLYDAPVDEFSVLRHVMSPKSTSAMSLDGPSIIICVSGNGIISNDGSSSSQDGAGDCNSYELYPGAAFYVGPSVKVTLKNEESNVECYQAFSKIK